jgi:chromosome segregation ATPase
MSKPQKLSLDDLIKLAAEQQRIIEHTQKQIDRANAEYARLRKEQADARKRLDAVKHSLTAQVPYVDPVEPPANNGA